MHQSIVPVLRRLPAIPGVRGCAGIGAVLLVLLALAPAGHASTVEGLYEARVAVRDQGDDERERGFREGLERVAVRVTGSAQVLEADVVRDLLDDAARYVQSFRYRELETDDALDRELQVTFNGSRLERELRSADIFVWGRRRPEVLAWVAVDDGRQRYIVSPDDGAATRAELLEHARRRGLPLLFPLLDVEDQGRIDFIDIRAGFHDAVAEASERYRASDRLIGYVARRGADDWRGEWTLVVGDEEIAWEARGRAREAVVRAGIAGATERLVERFSERAEEAARLRVTVGAVDSLADYARVSEYLGGLDQVETARLERLRPGSARFAIELRGGLPALERNLAIDNVLEPAAEDIDPEPAAGERQAGEGESAAALDDLVEDLLSGDGAGGETAATPADGEAAVEGEAPADEPVIERSYRLAG